MLKHACQFDPGLPQDTHKAPKLVTYDDFYKEIVKDGVPITIVEKVKRVGNPNAVFEFTDFNVKSLIVSGNLDLLKGVGTLQSDGLSAHDNINTVVDKIENLIPDNIEE